MTVHRLRPSTERRGRPLDFVLARRRFDGVIAVGIEPGERDRSLLRNLDVPIVAAGSAIDGFPSHRIDDTAVGRRATEHLIALGHRRIAHLGGPFSETLPDSAHGRRLHGYLDAMSAAGLEPMATFPVAALTVPTGYEAGVDLLARSGPRPTAVFAACDEGAIGVIVAARHLGLEVPAELSVIGIDGHEYAEMFGLTTFEQQPRQQGSDAASTLLSIFDGADAPVDIPPVLTRLAVRSSTTPPRRT